MPTVWVAGREAWMLPAADHERVLATFCGT
jgi:hypothetical protein